VLCNLCEVGPFGAGRIADALRGDALAEPAWPQATPSTGVDPDAVRVELRPYVGHYRSHSPWSPGFHVLGHDGGLALRLPGFALVPLVRHADGTFAVDDDVEGPSQIEFGDVIEGRAARATCDGVDLYRVSW
jgi:hypothetical protein